MLLLFPGTFRKCVSNALLLLLIYGEKITCFAHSSFQRFSERDAPLFNIHKSMCSLCVLASYSVSSEPSLLKATCNVQHIFITNFFFLFTSQKLMVIYCRWICKQNTHINVYEWIWRTASCHVVSFPRLPLTIWVQTYIKSKKSRHRRR